MGGNSYHGMHICFSFCSIAHEREMAVSGDAAVRAAAPSGGRFEFAGRFEFDCETHAPR